jgi:hypothetical protein
MSIKRKERDEHYEEGTRWAQRGRKEMNTERKV